MIKSKGYILFAVVLLFSACKTVSLVPKQHDFPDPVDTSSKPIEYQEKKTYKIDGVYASNEFDGARLNDFSQVNDSTFRATIRPENEPINESAYYGLQIWSDEARKIDLELYYPGHEHRYVPKLSYDAKDWIHMDTLLFDTLKGSEIATLDLDLDQRRLYVTGSELQTSKYNLDWSKGLATKYNEVEYAVIGKSKLGRDLLYIDICQGEKENKEAIAILSRQHPPEVSGYMAMQSFVETILDDSPLSKTFRSKFRILVYPMVNPDGVDLGHWRHSAGGIDMNRDWGYYVQEEPKVVVNHMTKTLRENKNELLIGYDFHSTQEDVMYTLSQDLKSNVAGFKDIWIQALDEANFNPNDEPYPLNQPISKGWFLLEHQAEGITYEVGDETPREYVKAKAAAAAKEMMKLLVMRK